MKLQPIFEGYCFEDDSSIEQPTQAHIELLCKHLGLLFDRETAIALIYGDNNTLPERILPVWLNELK